MYRPSSPNQRSFRDKHGDVDQQYTNLLRRVSPQVETTTFNVTKGEFPRSDHLREFHGLIITGSKASAYDKEEWIEKLCEHIRMYDMQKKKMWGVCFGHQVISHALGGKVEKIGWNLSHEIIHTSPEVQQESKYHSADDEEEGGGVPPLLQILCVHQDQVTRPPEGSKVWCWNEVCKVQGIIKDNHILTIQAHPEFSASLVRDLLYLKEEAIPSDLRQEALQRVDKPTNEMKVAQWVYNWFAAADSPTTTDVTKQQ